MIHEDLRAWFGKGKKGGVGGGGWDRYNASGDRVGKCGDVKEGDPYSACLSKEKAAKLGKAGRAAFVKRKRAAQKKGGDAKKGGERSKGQKPIKVKTGVNENFADGKKPGRKGLSKRFGISQKMSIAQLEKIANSSSGEKKKMAQWNLNMKRGRMKKENLDPDTFKDTGKAAPYGSGYRKVNEIGEANISPYKYKVAYTDGNIYKTDGYQEYEFDTDAGTNYGVQVSNKEGYLVIEFVTATGYDLTNEKEPFKIMSTVTSIIKGILEKDKGNYLKGIQYVLSPEKGIDRDRLYRAFIKKQRPGTTFKETGSWNNELVTATFPKKKVEERLNLFLEKNVPTDPGKWSYYKSQAKKKFDVYPSAYANAWAAKKYKEAGGRWRVAETKITALESNLLKVSKPYEILPGDMVRNINPDCTHYRSTGKVVFVHDDGDITYQVNNQGATYTPGDELTKSADQLIKIFTHTPRPGYGSFSNESKLNECVVAKVSFPETTVLAKNRDRGYKAEIEVIHEIINGVEVVYLHDRLTDWSEGMNEFGIGIINASLTVDFDEKEGDIAKQNIEKGKAPNTSYDGLKIRTALATKRLSEAVRSVVSFKGEDSKDVGVKGMTIIANPNHSFLIEMTSKHAPIIKKIDSDKVVVRTNHGIAHPETGYTSGIKRKSSESRMKIAQEKLNDVSSPHEVLNVLSKQYTKDNFLNPYRRTNKYDMETTSQIMYNLNDLEFTLRWDIDHSEFKGIVSHLPSGYNPKIKVIVTEID